MPGGGGATIGVVERRRGTEGRVSVSMRGRS